VPSSTELLRRVDESLAGLTGETFFVTLARSLAEALEANCAFVCEFVDDNSQAKPLAFFLNGDAIAVDTYDLAGTPCERVLIGDIVAFADNVSALFPEHRDELEAINANSYIAIPMTTRRGQVIGHIAVIDSRPRDWAEADTDILNLCSSRASGELEHEQMHRALAVANSALEDRVRERTRELERANEEMEQHVAERTASLAAVNARLRHEVAARAEAEAALRRQEEAYRDLYENAPNVYWSTGADGLIKRANRRALEVFGYTREELIGKRYIELVAPGEKGRAQAKRIFGRFLDGKPTYAEELEFCAADGRTIWANVSVVPIFDENGAPLATRSVLDDITERKRAAEALNRRLELERLIAEVATEFVGARPEDVDKGFARAIEKIGVWGNWDSVRVFLGSSDSTSRRLTYQWNEGTGDSSSQRSQFRRRLVRDVEQVADIPDVATLADCSLKRVLRQHGVGALIVVPIRNSAAALGSIEFARFERTHDWLPEDVDLLRLLGEVMAATLLRCAAESELQAARADAEAASLAKSEFLARMSHELRTPLNAILGYTQLMQRDSALPKNRLDQIGIIRRAGEHLLTLINEVLDLARIESGRLDVREVEVDLALLTQDIEAMFRSRAEQAGLQFRVDRSAALPRCVLADDGRLRQILINLLGNAVKFTPRGGTVALQVSAAEDPEDSDIIVFAIEDSGIGIGKEKLERIFEPFYQVDDRSDDGLGLGLAITQRLVAAMNGSISVSSEPGRGTQFRVRLPLSRPDAAPPNAMVLPRINVTGFNGRPRRILVADDQSENREVLRDFLQPLGFSIDTAVDGQEVLNAVKRECPDLLLIDLVMPRLDGFATINEIRRIPQAERLKIIAVSANAFETTRKRCKAAGCDAFLAKPIVFDEALQVMGEVLDLQWRYLDGGTVSPQQASSSRRKLTNSLPARQLAELQDCVRSGDIVAINARLNELERQECHQEIVDHLRPLTARFDLRAIASSLAELSAIEEKRDGAS